MKNKIIIMIIMLITLLCISGCNREECPVCEECQDCADIQITATLSPDALYYCESRDIYSTCTGFTKYVAELGKCLNPDGNLICRDGWKLVDVPEPEPEPIVTSSREGSYNCKPVSQGGCQVN